MAKHRQFTDRAGYTRHCWECVHAKNWRPKWITGEPMAYCVLIDHFVDKFDSPNNPCSHLGTECYYDDGRSDFDGIKGDSRG